MLTSLLVVACMADPQIRLTLLFRSFCIYSAEGRPS